MVELSSLKRFEEIRKANQAAVHRFADEDTSSEEEGGDDFENQRGKIVASTFTSYSDHIGEIKQMCLIMVNAQCVKIRIINYKYAYCSV